MKRSLFLLGSIPLFFLFTSLIVRDDVADERFIELAKKYPQLCHLPMGEATLIDSSWALTAGHVGSDLQRDIQNHFSPTIRCGDKEYAIEKIVLHPSFENGPEGITNDIALIKIKGAVQGISPAKIYSAKDEKDMNIILAGMGDIGNGLTGPQKWDKITRAATNRIDQTEDLWISFDFDAPGSADVTAMEGISGPGDSGGPAFYEKNKDLYIVGVSSHQKSKNGKGKYGAVEYYSRVSSYADWIKTILSSK
jgi:hypothetical protein